jgi:hypothetical protein
MADKDNDARAHRQTAEPDPDLEGLGRLVGTWVMCAEVWGTVDLRVDGGRLLPYPARRSRAVGRPEDHGYRGHWSRTAVRGQAERGEKEPLLLQHGRHHLLRLRARRGHFDDLDRGEGVSGVLHGHVWRRRRHPQRRVALSGGGGYEATSTRVG